jgi:hypothetical protein
MLEMMVQAAVATLAALNGTYDYAVYKAFIEAWGTSYTRTYLLHIGCHLFVFFLSVASCMFTFLSLASISSASYTHTCGDAVFLWV